MCIRLIAATAYSERWRREGNASWQQEQFVSMDDTAGQQQLLKDGFVGKKIKKTGDTWLVHYVK
mgnify:CR=1 FL=1